MAQLHTRFGEVAEVSAGFGRRLVFLFGADANAFVLSEGKENFRFREAFQSLAPVTGQTALIVLDGAEHTRTRSLVQSAFRPHAIDGYLEMMSSEADRLVASLPDGEIVRLAPRLRSATRRAVVRGLFGDRLSARADEIGDTIEPAIAFVNLPPQQQLKIKLPGTRYTRALRARGATDRIIDAELDRRESLPEEQRPDRDVIGMLAGAVNEDGARLSRAQLRDQIISLIAAGYDTTSAALAWAVHLLITNPGSWQRLREEVTGVNDREITRLHFLDGVVHETLRLYPPGVVAVRYAVGDFEFAGRLIKRKSLVFYSPYTTQRDPGYWEEPEAFRPERWHPDGADHWVPAPNTFVAFGGGQRRCIGFGFATLQMKVFLAALVRQTDLTAAYSGVPAGAGMATVHPVNEVPVIVRHVSPG